MASLNAENTTNQSKINLEDIELPEGPPDTSEENLPKLESVKINENSESDLDSDDDNSVKKVEKKETKVEKEEEKPKLGIVGLCNIGNTCYLNSVLQILSNLDDFRNFLFKLDFIDNLKKDVNDTLFCVTHRIIKHLWETTADDLRPRSFREKFVEKQKQFLGFEQQDSNEALVFLLDILHEEIARKIDINFELSDEISAFCLKLDNYFDNKSKFDEAEKKEKKASIQKLINSERSNALDYFAIKYLHEIAKNYSNISDYFGIISCELKKCPNCDSVKYQFQQNYVFQVPLPELNDDLIKASDTYKKLFEEKKEELKDKISNEELISKFCVNQIKNTNIYNLNDLLIHTTIPEIMDENNLYNCTNCSQKVKAICQQKLLKTPKYFIIHFKRFNHVMQGGNAIITKLKNLIKYDKVIDIKNLMVKDSFNTKYELVGGINHMGEYSGGHFTAFASNNNKWYNFNDSHVNHINIPETDIPLSPNAYMLIYKQCICVDI
jgi:ubiquitin C-terminal hydrolase